MKRRLRWFLFVVVSVVFATACGGGGGGETEEDVAPQGDTADSQGTCTPQCEEKTCGDDGCGGVCGTCSGNEECIDSLCLCQPECKDKECGDDGCGGNCGFCLDNEECTDGICVCQPACEGKVCGPDGCGGLCGDCPGTQDLCVDGECVCQPVCLGVKCGDDGCGGTCGECECGETCDAGKCVYHGCEGKVCGDDGCGVSCGECECGETCDEGACVFHACDGMECGDDGCGGVCGVCPGEQDECQEGLCVCIPDCDGKECGPDGCGGSCGECAEGIVCAVEGTCAPACSPVDLLSCSQPLMDDTSKGVNVYSSYGCVPNEDSGPELSYLFTPTFDGEVAFNVGDYDGWDPDLYLLGDPCGKDECLAFGESGLTHTVEAGKVYYVVVDGYNGTSGTFTLTADCACDPLCEGKQCGEDGCGGVCGKCPVQHVCEEGLCICVPDCEGKQCGDDGCGGSCGDCLGECVDFLCHEGPGCEVGEGTGCEGCSCEACVCWIDPYCCDTLWDSLCVGECINDCGGCAELDTCGDGSCEGYESCINCPEDCDCGEDVCFLNECCTPWCGGMNCGDDGCGGVCGECAEGQECMDGACLTPPSGPGCEVIEGVAGCGGCDCEACVCEMDAWCCNNEWDAICVGECQDCGFCLLETECGNGICEPGEDCALCAGDCPCKPGHWCNEGTCEEGECPVQCDGKECGDDGCGGSCGECGEGTTCFEDLCCTPWCGGMICGDDGCGGLFGECAEGDECIAGACMAPPSGPGCEPTEGVAGCGGCECEACVCELDPYCCDTEWDSLCVGECKGCGSCPYVTECGNGLCEPGEDCALCADDCPCMPGTTCQEGFCLPEVPPEE